MHHALRESAAYVGYQLTDHTCIEGGEEPVESLGRVVGLSVCIAEPLECRDTDDPIKRTRTKAQPLPHVPMEQVSFNLPISCHSCDGGVGGSTKVHVGVQVY